MKGASAIDEQRRIASLHAVRTAVWGKAEDIANLGKAIGAGMSTKNDDTAEALNVFGLEME